MNFTGRAAEYARHMEDVTKETQTTRKKIVPTKSNIQICKKATSLSQDLMTYTKK